VGLALGPGEATLFFTAAGAGGKGLYSTPNGGGAVTTLRAFANPANGAVLDTLYEYRGLALMPTISSCPAGTWMTGSAAAPFAIICTINCSSTKVDQALLRPGRLLARRSFNRLSQEEAARIARRTGKTLARDIDLQVDYSLAEIFNQSIEESDRPDRIVGFAS
jgi:hypothetical protein